MVAASIAKPIEYRRRVLGRPNATRFFAIERAQRISLDTPLAIVAQLISTLSQERQQNFAISRPAVAAAERIDLQGQLGQSEGMEEITEQKQDLRVDQRIAPANRFRADLVELAHPALLRPLAPEHRPHIIQLSNRLGLEHLRFDISAHD